MEGQHAVIVELKSLRSWRGTEVAQMLNFLKAAGSRKGLHLNFDAPQLQSCRFISAAALKKL